MSNLHAQHFARIDGAHDAALERHEALEARVEEMAKEGRAELVALLEQRLTEDLENGAPLVMRLLTQQWAAGDCTAREILPMCDAVHALEAVIDKEDEESRYGI